MRTIITPHGVFQTFDHDAVGNALATNQFWDEQIRAALDAADPTGWALDLGANIGWFTVYLARRHPYVLAVEAHPTTYDVLCRNVIANGVDDHVAVLNVAAYNRVTRLALAPGHWHGWEIADEIDLDRVPNAASLAFVPELRGVTSPTLTVHATNLDRYVAGQHVSLIKVDCQGCDLPALVGLKQTIHRDRPLIVFEYEGNAADWHGTSWQDYLDFFEARDYAVERIREDLWDFVARPR